MTYKLIAFFLFVALVSQVSSRNVRNTPVEVRLPDRVFNHLTNQHIGFGISIPHLMLDTLEACMVTFPDGFTYEAFPTSNLPSSVIAQSGVFPSCGIQFRNPPVSMSGVYELTALTTHWDGRRTTQFQRWDVRINEIKP